MCSFATRSLTASLPPWITSIFEAAYFVPLSHSSPLNLKCKAQNGNISYRWFKDNDKLHTNDRVVVNEQSGDITFRNLIKKDFGLYYCVAENKHGSSVSSFVKILEAALGVFGVITNKTIACKVFHHCKISCSNKPNCQPINECKFEWKSGAATANTIITNENIAIDSEGDLHFLNFNRSYASHDLSCGIWNEKLRIFTKGSFYTVEINEHNSTAISQSIWKNNPKAVIGENATLQCIFSGSPVPNIQWLSISGSMITSNSKYVIKQYGRELLIRNVTFDDDGFYRCVADGNLTNDIYLNVTAPPIFADSGSRFMMRLLHFSYQEETEISCNAISAPNELKPVVMQWMKNGRILHEGIDFIYFKYSSFTFSEEKSKLHIAYNLTINETSGCYTCVIKNSEGIAVANFILTTRNSDIIMNNISHMYAVITVCAVMVIILGVIIVRKKVICKTNEYTPEEVVEVEEDRAYSDPVIELSENIYSSCCDEELSYDTPQMMPSVDNPDHYYNSLRECIGEQADNNCYDCADNVSGIYNISFRRNSHTMMRLSDNLRSVERCKDT
uniref:Ig-like domain-containing protein n=1 Tax=Magallana gigas TaxID=29159 RepID=A0A8W8I7D2_MAGGI